MTQEEWQTRFKEGTSTKARIVYVDHGTKSLRLSLRPHVVTLAAPILPELGSKIIDLTVVKTSRQGVLMSGPSPRATADAALDDEEEKETEEETPRMNRKEKVLQQMEEDMKTTSVFIARSNLASEDESKETAIGIYDVEVLYPVGKEIEAARVIGYHLVESIAIASNLRSQLKSIEDGTVMHATEVSTGQVLTATVQQVQDFGLVVALAGGRVSAVCPVIHLGESALSLTAVKKKFHKGMKIKVRVWETDGHSIVVTQKKGLVEAKDASVLTSYTNSNASPGSRITGLVSRVTADGLRVHFFNKIKGEVSIQALMKQGVMDPVQSFKVGEVVRCVLLVNPLKSSKGKSKSKTKGRKTLKLSLDMGNAADSPDEGEGGEGEEGEKMEEEVDEDENEDGDDESDDQSDDDSDSEVDEKQPLCSGAVTRLTRGAQGEIEIVEIRLEDGRVGRLPTIHYTDLARCALDRIEGDDVAQGSAVDEVLVLGGGRDVVVTHKPLLLKAFKETDADIGVYPSTTADVIVGQHVVGVVSRVESFGIFVRFRGRLSALVPRSNVNDDRRIGGGDLQNLFWVGDTVRGVITSIDQESDRLIMSLKQSEVVRSSGDWCFLRQYLRESRYNANSSGDKIDARIEEYLGSEAIRGGGNKKDGGIQGHALKVYIKALSASINVMVIGGTKDDWMVKQKEMVKMRVLFSTHPLSRDNTKHSCRLVCSIESSLLKSSSSKSSSLPDACLGRVEYIPSVNSPYFIASIDASSSKSSSSSAKKKNIALVSFSDYHHPYSTPSKSLSLGDMIKLHMVSQPIDDAHAEYGELLPVYAYMGKGKSSTTTEDSVTNNDNEDVPANATKGEKVKEGKDEIKVGSIKRWVVKRVEASSLTLELEKPEIVSTQVIATCHISCSSDDNGMDDQLEASLGLNIKEDHREKMSKGHPFYRIATGDVIKGRVLQIRYTGKTTNNDDDDDSEIEAMSRTSISAYVSLVSRDAAGRAADKGRKMIQWTGAQRIKESGIYTGVVVSFGQVSCLVALSPYVSGSLNFMDVSNNEELVRRFQKHCYVGMRVSVACTSFYTGTDGSRVTRRVTFARSPIETLMLHDTPDLNKEVKTSITKWKAAAFPTAGEIVMGCVLNTSSKGCFIRLSSELTGRVMIKDLSDQYVESPEETFPRGKLVRCRVLEIDEDHRTARLSLKMSEVEGDGLAEARMEAAMNCKETNRTVKGTISSVTNFGVFVDLQLPGIVTSESNPFRGLARLHDALSHKDIESGAAPKDLFSEGDIVRAKILKVSLDRVSLGLKPSYFKNKDDDSDSDDDSNSNDEEEESEQSDDDSVESDGSDDEEELEVEVSDNDSDKSDEEDEDDDSDEDEDDEDDLPTGDENDESFLTARDAGESDDDELEEMIKQASASRDVKSDDEDQDSDSDSDSNSDSNSDNDDDDDDEDDENAMDVDNDSNADTDTDSDSDSDSDEDSDEDEDETTQKSNKKSAGFKNILMTPGLPAAPSLVMQWDDNDLVPTGAASSAFARPNKKGDDDSDSDDDSDNDVADSDNDDAPDRKQRINKQREEAELRKRENALADGTAIPESIKDFERLLVGNVNSSYLWIQYIAFHLKHVDIDRARRVAKRAIEVIDYREEEEKFNVWMAWLNVEYKYGSMESLDDVFSKATQHSFGKRIYLQFAEVYAHDNDFEGACQLLERALKKPQYKKSKKVWSAIQRLHLQAGDPSAAKKLLTRSMQSLGKHKHIWIIKSYAFAEFDIGSPDRARNLFEELLSDLPKRLDLWHLYVDREIKAGNIQQARSLFERMTTLKMSTKMMSSLFKKWLVFERESGDEETCQAVMQKATEYRNSLL